MPVASARFAAGLQKSFDARSQFNSRYLQAEREEESPTHDLARLSEKMTIFQKIEILFFFA